MLVTAFHFSHCFCQMNGFSWGSDYQTGFGTNINGLASAGIVMNNAGGAKSNASLTGGSSNSYGNIRITSKNQGKYADGRFISLRFV